MNRCVICPTGTHPQMRTCNKCRGTVRRNASKDKEEKWVGKIVGEFLWQWVYGVKQ